MSKRKIESFEEVYGIPDEALDQLKNAKALIDEFLSDIDPELSVEIDWRHHTMTPDKPYAESTYVVVLRFTHANLPELKWTIGLTPGREHTRESLEKLVRETYQRQLEQLRGDQAT